MYVYQFIKGTTKYGSNLRSHFEEPSLVPSKHKKMTFATTKICQFDCKIITSLNYILIKAYPIFVTCTNHKSHLTMFRKVEWKLNDDHLQQSTVNPRIVWILRQSESALYEKPHYSGTKVF